MIEFLENKKIDFNDIENILLSSKNNNHYTNNGPVKKLLEQKLEKLLSLNEDKCVLCVSSGTSALHTLLYHYNNKYGDNISWASPAFTFPSCIVGNNSNVYVFDISPNTHTLPLPLNNHADGFIITNLFGSYVNIEKWEKFCKNNNKILIFDNAASPLSLYNGVNICNFGNFSFGSLHHTKYIGFGEGGFIVAPKEDYNALTAITNFGFDGSRNYNTLSSNFKMSDISAAFILQHIEQYNIQQHIKNQNKLLDGISNIKHVVSFNYQPGTIYNTFPVIFDKEIEESYFYSKGVVAHKYYKPLYAFKNSNKLYERIINFPLYAGLTDDEINIIIDIIRNVK